MSTSFIMQENSPYSFLPRAEVMVDGRNILKEYFDLCNKWNHFTLRYSFAFYDAAYKSLQSFFNFTNDPYPKIQNSMRSTFDSTLRRHLKEEKLASLMGELVDTRIKFDDLTGYAKIRNSFIDIFLAGSRLLEPIRDTLNVHHLKKSP